MLSNLKETNNNVNISRGSLQHHFYNSVASCDKPPKQPEIIHKTNKGGGQLTFDSEL